MKAAWYTRNGSARDVLIVGELPTPQPAPGEVLVRLHTSGVNPSDVKSRLRRPLVGDLVVPHSDGGGVIEAVGEGVASARVGQRVWIWNGQWQRPMGTAAEYIALPQAQAVELPSGVDFEAAACLGIPALTAIQALRLAGPVSGKTMLVTGAGNAVGHYVTQLAVSRGATVIGTAGAEARQQHAKDAGAAHVIHYKTEVVPDRVRDLTAGQGVDLIIDMDFSSSAAFIGQGVLKPHGQLIAYGSNAPGPTTVDFPSMLWNSLSVQVFLVYQLLPDDRQAVLAEVTGLLQTQALQHTVGPRYALDDIAAAHEAVESGQHVGNVLMAM